MVLIIPPELFISRLFSLKTNLITLTTYIVNAASSIYCNENDSNGFPTKSCKSAIFYYKNQAVNQNYIFNTYLLDRLC